MLTDMLVETMMVFNGFRGLSGEDLLFANEVKREGCHWKFVMQSTYVSTEYRSERLTRKR